MRILYATAAAVFASALVLGCGDETSGLITSPDGNNASGAPNVNIDGPISDAQAITIALGRVDGEAVGVEREREDGRDYVEVEVRTADGKVMSVEMEVDTGKVVEVEEEDDDD